MSAPDSFTIRIYGLLIHQQRILLSRERIQGKLYTKFPGGGLEFGEGVIDCLKREFEEEVGIRITHWDLFHVNENYLSSAFHTTKQVLTIYYKVWSDQLNLIQATGECPSDEDLKHTDQVLYWLGMDDLVEEDIALPIDREVVSMLIKQT